MRPAIGRAHWVQRAPLRTLVGVQWTRELLLGPRPNGLATWFLGSGKGRVEPLEPCTLIDGTEGVTEMEGALFFAPRLGAGDSLTEIDGISGVTEIWGTFADDPLFGIGDSLTEIEGTGGETPMVGTFIFGARLP